MAGLMDKADPMAKGRGRIEVDRGEEGKGGKAWNRGNNVENREEEIGRGREKE